MRVRYSFSSRHTGQAKDPRNIRKQRQKYPAIAQRVIIDSDIILEVLDARFLSETQNPEIESQIKSLGKEIIFVANKADLISEEKRRQIPSDYSAVSCKERKGVRALRDKIKMLASKTMKDKVVVGILGYPNTGKSSLINILIGKKSAKTGSDAGFTKGLQKIKLTSKIVLLDSPGVIPKKEYSTIESKRLAKHTKVGARSYSQVRDPESIIVEMIKEFPGVLESYYEINANGDSDILLEELGRKKGFLKKGGVVDFDKVSRIILRDWQEGKIRPQ